MNVATGKDGHPSRLEGPRTPANVRRVLDFWRYGGRWWASEGPRDYYLLELETTVRVNGLAPAMVVEGSSMFPRERVISSLAKYGVEYSEAEETDALRGKLAAFYARRTLTGSPVTLADQAEAAYLLSSSKLAKTTGQVLSVDGGLHEAFLR